MTKMEFINLKAQYQSMKAEIDSAVTQVFENANFIMGDEVKILERELALYCGAKHCITCANGTDALMLALMALGIGKNDEVITSPLSFIATAEAIAFLGAKPVFSDIDGKTYNLDPAKIEEKITKKTKAIIPVSLYGQTPDMDEINAIAKKHNIIVIEDAAQSFGADYKGKKSCNISEMSCTSFFPSKPLGCYGDGGAIFTSSDELADKLRALRVHGQTKRYSSKYIGVNSRLDTVQAAILLIKLKYFEREIKERNRIATQYNRLINNKNIATPFVHPDRNSVWAQYSIRIKNRNSLAEALKVKGIPTTVYYPIPLHLQEALLYLGYKKGDFPICEAVCEEIISLPMSAFVTSQEQDLITAELITLS